MSVIEICNNNSVESNRAYSIDEYSNNDDDEFNINRVNQLIIVNPSL